jgi:hypothetical protein
MSRAAIACDHGAVLAPRPSPRLLAILLAAACAPGTTMLRRFPPPEPPAPPDEDRALSVRLVPAPGVTGVQLVNFAVPLPPGRLHDPGQVRVLLGGAELPAARRALARHPDGSVRSVQLQVQVELRDRQVLRVRLGEAPATATPALADMTSTLVLPDGSRGPRVWARLSAGWLSASGVAGPQVPEARTHRALAAGLARACDYERHAISAFLPVAGRKDAWLYDRGTALYRGYARRGDLTTLESAYRETALYRSGITGAGASTRIGVPGSPDDLKYHYAQGLAIHYLLTGDDRFREAAEAVADRVAALWPSPGYDGGDDFWTERHAGFALLAYVWAAIVSDDHGPRFRDQADAAVDAYLAMQDRYPPGWTDASARCFAHHASAHGEDYGTWGCSPWMSAILADALDAYATLRGGPRAEAARASIVKLGTLLAREGLDRSGKPLYWLGLGAEADVPDDHDEHWGDSAYVVAMAWHLGGRTDASLRRAALALVDGLATRGGAPHLRSFNWQCRSAVATPFYLQ